MALLTDQEIEDRLARLDGWERDGDEIVKKFKHDDFAGSVAFVNRILGPAEALQHHPELKISWNKVKVSITTDSEGGLTESDFELAGKIDSL